MKQNYKIIILSFCLLSSILLNFINIDFATDQDLSNRTYETFDTDNLLNSYTPVAPFFIDDSDPIHSWNYYKTNYGWCTGTGTLADPYVIDDISIGGGGSETCLEVRWTSPGTYWTIQNSYFADTGVSSAGIYVGSSTNGDILSCIFYDCYFGISVEVNSHNMYIYNNTVTDGLWGINIQGSDNAELVDNTVLRCQNQGIAIEDSASCKIIGNTVNETTGKTIPADIEMGIWVAGSINIEVINNTCYNNDKDGIMIVECDSATVSGNIANDNGDSGIRILDCDNCDIIENTVNDNTEFGIFEHDNCINNIYQNNTCNTVWGFSPFVIDGTGGGDFTWAEAVDERDWCSGAGTFGDPYVIEALAVDGGTSENCIEIRNSNAYFIINGSIFSNGIYGIKLDNTDNGQIINNTVKNCVSSEIWLEYSSDNKILKNIVDSSSNYAIYLEYSDQNNVSLNIITGNAHCIYEINSVNNIIENNVCNIDIIITINSPTTMQLTGSLAPDFDISLSIIDPNTTWYSVDGGITNKTFTGLTGTIDQIEWNGQGAGLVTIRFYANNSMNQISFSDVIVQKDLSGPIITINSPSPNDIFNGTAPFFDVDISGPALDSYWYTIDGGLNNYTFTPPTGQINQGAWDLAIDGNVTIRFYANTSIGNLNYQEVTVIRDTRAPLITINSPSHYDVFGLNAPSYSISINEPNLDAIWYSLDGGTTNTTITETTGIINQTIWEGFMNESVTISFYASDELGRVNTTEVSVWKDIIKPVITIHSPFPNELFGFTPPTFNISIDEANPGTTCYNLIGDPLNYTFMGLLGNISLVSWNLFSNGTLTIRFYATDAAGNVGFTDILIRKDIIDPVITIHSPLMNDYYSVTAPTFNISINEPHLNTTWYNVIGVPVDFPVVGTTGNITQWAWDALGNGGVTIRFYATDYAGNMGFTDVGLTKDTINPIVTVDEPLSGEVFGDRAPAYNISVEEQFFNRTWYKIIGETLNYTFTGITAGFWGTLDQSGWDLFWNETLTIRFYASDEAGNVGFKDAVINKDIYTELIFEIIYPEQDAEYGRIPPSYNLYVSILNISEMWYTLDNGKMNIPFTDLQGVINDSVWMDAPNGTVTIKFYVKDDSDNVYIREVDVIKTGIVTVYREINQVVEFLLFLFGFPNIILTLGCSIGVGAGGYFIVKKEKDPNFSLLKKKKKGPMK